MRRSCSCSRISSGPTAGLLEFIDYLLEWSADQPLFVLALGRPELLDSRPAWAAEAISLAPLPDAAMRELFEGLVPGLPEELAARVLSRAEGVPLYAVETVRMLLDRGLLDQDGQPLPDDRRRRRAGCARDAARARRRAARRSVAGRARGAPGRGGVRAVVHAGRASRRSSERSVDERDARSSTGWSPSRSSASTTTGCPPNAASTTSSAGCCGRPPTGRCRARTARAAISRPRVICRRLGRGGAGARRGAGGPLPRRRRRRSRRVRRAADPRRRRARRSPTPASARCRWRSAPRRSERSIARPNWPRTMRTRAQLLDQAGRAAQLNADYSRR